MYPNNNKGDQSDGKYNNQQSEKQLFHNMKNPT